MPRAEKWRENSVPVVTLTTTNVGKTTNRAFCKSSLALTTKVTEWLAVKSYVIVHV